MFSSPLKFVLFISLIIALIIWTRHKLLVFRGKHFFQLHLFWLLDIHILLLHQSIIVLVHLFFLPHYFPLNSCIFLTLFYSLFSSFSILSFLFFFEFLILFYFFLFFFRKFFLFFILPDLIRCFPNSNGKNQFPSHHRKPEQYSNHGAFACPDYFHWPNAIILVYCQRQKQNLPFAMTPPRYQDKQQFLFSYGWHWSPLVNFYSYSF